MTRLEITITRPASVPAGVLSRLVRGLRLAWQSHRRRVALERDLDRLSRSGSHLLRDIGMEESRYRDPPRGMAVFGPWLRG